MSNLTAIPEALRALQVCKAWPHLPAAAFAGKDLTRKEKAMPVSNHNESLCMETMAARSSGISSPVHAHVANRMLCVHVAMLNYLMRS